MLAQDTHTSDDATTSELRAALPSSYQKQSVLDTAQRMRNGLLIYPATWLLLIPVDGFAARHPWLFGINLMILSVASLVRLLFHRRLPRALSANFDRTQAIFRVSSLVYNIYWGCLCAWILQSSDAHTLRWLMFMGTVGITAGGTVIVAIDTVLPLLYPLCTLGPSVFVLLPVGGSINVAISAMTAMFFAYSVGISRLVGREYWSRQRTQALLEERAKELEAISRTDALTQIPNRLKFQESLTLAWRDAKRRREPIAIAMIDLDHFKRINDTHGHPFGDRCLLAAAQALAGVVRRPYDLVARYGGEEFVILMPNTSLEGAAQLAQGMLAQICQTVVYAGDVAVPLSCSIGVSACHPDPTSLADTLVREADEALYVAKQEGRGRVASHRPQPSRPSALLPKPAEKETALC